MDDNIEVIDSNNVIETPETSLKKKKNPLKIIIIILSSILILFLISYILLLVRYNFNLKQTNIILDKDSFYQIELDPIIKDKFDNKNYLFEIRM